MARPSHDNASQMLVENPFEKWAFPTPTKDDVQASSLPSNTKLVAGGKSFSPLISRLLAVQSGTEVTASPLVQLYKRKIQQAWDEGYNIVVASEHLDRVARDTQDGKLLDGDDHASSLTPDLLWQRLLACLPPHPDRIVVGIQHRTPRIDHLLSMWHQLAQRQESLVEFITKPTKPGLKSMAHSMNPLGLADFFVKKGYPVIIVDTGGMQAKGVDLPIAMACHVLDIPCRPAHTSTNDVESENGLELAFGLNETRSKWMGVSSKQKLNQRFDTGTRDLDEETLVAVNRLLEEYDCQYRHFADREDKVQMLYAEQTFATCRSKVETRHKEPFSKAIDDIVQLVCHHRPQSKHCRHAK
eukprot:Nitzschia sp. Nitz4//scaffold201_size42423//18125//19192//NITZ4_007375-RA/size42423-processed-gene-0.53-mRNA-1//-1//CDS//3329541335//7537//frame0